MSLKDKAISGMLWTFIEQFATRGIGLIVQILLARLLLPEDFGLVAMVAVFLSIGNALVDAGMTQSIIRTKETDEEDYSTVFFINLFVAILVYLIIFILAPYIAEFYNQPKLILIVRVYCIGIIIKSFSGIQITRLTKAMDFKTQTLVLAPSLLISGIVGIVMAYKNFGVWSIVFMKLIQDTISTIQYFIHTKWLPILAFKKDKLYHHFNFGSKITAVSILNALFSEAYNILIGKYFSANILGFYNRAFTFQKLPVDLFSRSLNRVTFPVFSELQYDDFGLKRAYRRIMKQSMFLLAPLMTLLICIAEPLFRVVLTEKWLPAVPIFQILAIVGLLTPIQNFNVNILKAKGLSGLLLKINVFKKAFTIFGIIIFIQKGIYPLLWFQVVNSFIMLAVNVHYCGKFINYQFYDQVKDISYVIVLNIIIAPLFYFTFANVISFSNDILYIFVFSFLFLISYLFLSRLLKLEEYKLTRELIEKSFIQKLKLGKKG